jgi:hypothetical protein
VTQSSQRRRQQIIQWIGLLLSPLWAYIAVEALRVIDFLDINRYNGWNSGEILCSREVAELLNAVYVEYWHFPVLDAWIAFTFSFFILGLGILLRANLTNGGGSRYRLSLVIVVAVTLASVIFGLISLIAPKGEQLPFFVLSAISLFLVLTLCMVRGYFNKLVRRTLALSFPIFAAYVFGLLISFFIYSVFLNLNLLPAIAYCQIH